MSTDVIAIAAVAIAGFAAIASFGWALYRERGLRADADLALVQQNEMAAMAHATEVAKQRDKFETAYIAVAVEKANADVEKIRSSNPDELVIISNGQRVLADPFAEDNNPSAAGAAPMPAAATPSAPKPHRGAK